MNQREALTLILLLAALAAAVAARLAVGGSGVDPEVTRQLLEIRLMRVGTGAAVGAALAVAGVLLQSLLRNPLASPDLLGLASGAGLGVMVAVYGAYLAGQGLAYAGAGGPVTGAAALVGSVGALGLVYAFGQRRGLIDPVSIILVGVIVAILCGAGIQLVRHLLPDQGVAASRLLLGSLRDDVRGAELAVLGGIVLAGVLVAVGAGRAMDAAALGEDEARSVGVSIGPLRAVQFGLAGVLTTASVLLAGPVGFVGLICPHAVRLFAGPRHGPLVVGSALAGALLVVGADTLVRSIDLPTGRLPISVLTALIGGPLLIYLLRRTQRGF